jgi:hypothetical protein
MGQNPDASIDLALFECPRPKPSPRFLRDCFLQCPDKIKTFPHPAKIGRVFKKLRVSQRCPRLSQIAQCANHATRHETKSPKLSAEVQIALP